MHSLLKLQRSQFYAWLLGAAWPLVVLVGVIILTAHAPEVSYASIPPAISLEPESATSIVGSACKVSSDTASRGQAISFGCGGPTASGQLAQRSADFLNSMGVVAHVGAMDYSDQAKVISDLQYVGIHSIRTGDGGGSISYRQALANNGVSFDYVTLTPAVGRRLNAADTQTSVNTILNDIATKAPARSSLSFEPYNEFDNASDNGGDPNYDSVLRSFQNYAWSQVRGRSDLSNLKLLGPALIGNSLASSARKVGDLSAVLDYGNVHSYFGGKKPESGYGDNTPASANFMVSAGCNSLNTDLTFDQRLAIVASCISKRKPLIITETGYHNDPTATTHKYTSETAAGVYLPRLFMEMFRIGILRTYVYELLDEPDHPLPSQERHFGFFRADNSPKPAAESVRWMTNLLADSGSTRASFAASKLDYQINGPNTQNLHRLLLQKSDNSFWLALWQGDAIFDEKTGIDIGQVTATVSLTVTQPAVVTVYSQDGPSGGSPQGRASSFTITTGPKLTLLKISP